MNKNGNESVNVAMLPEEKREYDAPWAKCGLDTLFVDEIFYMSFIITFATSTNY
jgi:hypothetical protein